MSMKKYVQNFWVRFLAITLCSVTLITGIAAGALIAGVELIDKKESYQYGQKSIARNYAAYIYEYVHEGEHQDIAKVESFLEAKNFTCSVHVLGDNPNTESGENEEVLILSNLVDENDWDYEFEIMDYSYVRYNVDSALDAIRIDPVIQSEFYTVNANITGYVFDENTGLFYCCADDQYFLVDYIEVVIDGPIYDFKLSTIDGKKVYYNGYYNITLDPSTYQTWNWVQISGTALFFAEDPNDVKNYEIQVVNDDRIQSNLYRGAYYQDMGDNTIDYSPDVAEKIYYVRMKVDDLTQSGTHYYDMFSDWENYWNAFYENEPSYEAVLVVSVVLFILSIALLIYSAKNKTEEIGFWNKVPVISFTLVIGVLELLCLECTFYLIDFFMYGYNVLPFKILITLFLLLAFLMTFLLCVWLQNIITRCKMGILLRYSEFVYGYKLVKWILAKVMLPFKTVYNLVKENTPLLIKGIGILVAIEGISFLAIITYGPLKTFSVLGFLIIKAIEIPVVILVLVQMKKLKEAGIRIAAGDLSEPVDTSKMFWEFKKHGENINKVSDGIALAVEERIKSERFKTELITNVSHDIKTPLTSIINYVDLIKKEDIKDETIQEYVEVLDRQSNRLKKLIEDLMEASKASTGNLSVNIEACDVDVLLVQLLGEFEEKLKSSQLEVVVQKPEKPVVVSADGRHMWRVLDNLLNNACKYSLPGSRVYVSLEQNEKEATIVFKNISKAPLNIPSDELMERFVRGDSSRNTEGSGLGLSIAQSLTELMQGEMKIEIDGDLFKVLLKFNICK